MRRREFIAGFASILPSLSLSLEAAQSLAIVHGGSEDGDSSTARIGAFRSRLSELGWVVGKNINISYHWGAAEPSRAEQIAREIVVNRPHVILANGNLAPKALAAATSSIPIVFVNVTCR